MARSDYAHWNEDQDLMWWQEEGRFQGTEQELPFCDLCGGAHHPVECPENMFADEEEDEDDEVE